MQPTTLHTALAQHRVARLATQRTTHRAFHWLHLHQPQLRAWQLEFLAIPAPTFAESDRAAWFLSRFHALGLTNVHLDEAGNALAELSPQPASETPLSSFGEPGSPPSVVGSEGWEAGGPAFVSTPEVPVILLSAHLDTVFPAGTPTTPTEDGPASSAPAPAITVPASPPSSPSPPPSASPTSPPPPPSSSPPTPAKKAKATSAA